MDFKPWTSLSYNCILIGCKWWSLKTVCSPKRLTTVGRPNKIVHMWIKGRSQNTPSFRFPTNSKTLCWFWKADRFGKSSSVKTIKLSITGRLLPLIHSPVFRLWGWQFCLSIYYGSGNKNDWSWETCLTHNCSSCGASSLSQWVHSGNTNETWEHAAYCAQKQNKRKKEQRNTGRKQGNRRDFPNSHSAFIPT